MAFINLTIDQAMNIYAAMPQTSQDSVNDRIASMMENRAYPADNATVIQAIRAEQIHTATLA